MKKLTALFLTLIILFTAAASPAETPAESMVFAAEELFFRTGNVTLSGEAVFSLDGTVFKTAYGTYIQDGERSFWQLILKTPRPSAPELGDRETGYTVIADSAQVYVMETYYPGVYKTGTVFPSKSILRSTVQLDLMDTFVRQLAKQTDTLLGENAVTVTTDDQGGTDVRIVLDENVPDLVNTALTVLFQYAGKRYFGVDYDTLHEDYMGPLSHYVTITQGILYTTEYMYLKQADVRVKMNASGDLLGVSGSVSVYLHTGGDGEHLLDIDFSMDVTDRGTSKVEPFDPEKYHVVPSGGQPSPQAANPVRSEPDAETAAAVVETVRTAAELAGYPSPESLEGYTYKEEDGRISCGMYNNDRDIFLTSTVAPDGALLRLTNENGNYNNSYPTMSLMKDYPDQALVQETQEKLGRFLETVNPEAYARMGELRLDYWFEMDGVLYFSFEEFPHRTENSVMFLVRALPEWQIDYYTCVSFG